MVAHLAASLAGREIGELLEIGCGTADYLYVLSRTLGARGHGFDCSTGMLAEAARKNPGLDLAEGDAEERFPYQDTLFDLAFSVDVIHYIGNLPSFFAETRRVLRPGGLTVVITDSHEDIAMHRTMSRYFPETVPRELKRYPGVPLIVRAMDEAGLTGMQTTHTRRDFMLDGASLELYRNRAYSALRLIPEEAFAAGVRRLDEDIKSGGCMGCELYTYIWGVKP